MNGPNVGSFGRATRTGLQQKCQLLLGSELKTKQLRYA